MRSLKRLSVLLITAAVFLTAAFLHVPVHAEEQKTIKVGYFSNGDFMRKNEDGSYEGYDVEYYYMLAQYTNWNIEFVDFSSLTDAENALEQGNIDILSGLSKNTARESRFLFSDAKMCTTKTAIQTRSDDDRFSLNDIATLSDMQCGIIKNSIIISLYTNWCTDHGLTAHIVQFDNAEERNTALADQKIDAIAAGSTVEGAQKIAEFPSFDIFFVMNKASTELKMQLDSAMSVLSLENSNFEETLMEKYFPSTRNSAPSFSRSEKEYISSHDTVNVGLLADNEPYSYRSGSTMKGFFPEYYQQLSSLTGIQFQCVPYTDMDTMYTALDAGAIDIIGESEKDAYAAAGRKVAQSNTFLSVELVQLIYTGTSSIKTAAVPRYNERTAQYNLDEIDSDVQLVVYDNNKQCMDALQHKEVDAVYFSRPAASYYLDRSRASDYIVTTLGTNPWQVAMSIPLGTDGSILRSILNKSLTADQGTINELISQDLIKDNTTFRTFLNQLPASAVFTIGACSLFISVIVIIALFIILSRRKRERKLAVEQAKVAADVELNKARHTFFGAVSHDMRTPLNGILGFTDLALKSSSPEEMKGYLKKIHTSGETLNLLVNDTLMMSRLENNQYILNPSPVELSEVMKDVILPIQQTAAENNITFIDEASPVCTGRYNLDRISVEKVFMNLLTNAVKFSNPGGTVRFACSKKENQFTFTVKDEGIGIDPEFQAHMFEPFSQEDKANSKAVGSGLGLAIVKSIVDAMNGTIQVASKKGQGTIFTVILHLEPCIEPVQKPVKVSVQSLEGLQGKHVLICEDNVLNMEIEASILEHAGMIVTKAENGKEGLDLFLKSINNYYDAVLMDLRMPVLDGISAAKALRSLPRPDAQKVYILAISADAFQENVQEAMDAGMNGHIAKPINADILLQTLSSGIQS